MKVAVLMSGGVDSSVTASLMLEAGHEVIGLTMLNWSEKVPVRAAEIANQLGIPHYVIDLRDDFDLQVIEPFCREYAAGRTPNPCIVCNEFIKFGRMQSEARKLGCERVATGHYARIERDDAEGCLRLLKGQDPGKDQSYFLYRLSQEQLSQCLFPLGEMTKQQVRDRAASIGLGKLAAAEESQEICFIRDYYGDFLKDRMELVPGPVVDISNGSALGLHRGLPLYTVGQRKGLGIAAGRPVYVVRLDCPANTLYVGDENEIMANGLEADDCVFTCREPAFPMAVMAKIRYAARPARAIVETGPQGTLQVKFEREQRAITPGQAVVFYQDQTVLGGGVIMRPFRY